MHLRKIYTLAAVLLFAGMASAQNLPKFSGLFFGDYYYVINAANLGVASTSNYSPSGGLQKAMQAFDYRRIYLTTDYDIAQDFSARFRLESDPSTSNFPTATGTSNGKLSVMVKDAFINWKNVTDGANIIIGLQGTPEINMAEGIFGYRSLEKTIQDLHGISSSRDLGISYNQKFSDAFTAGLLVGNNSGNSALSPTTSKYKAAYLYLQINPVKQFTILLNGQYNGTGVSVFNRTGDVIVNYANDMFSLGAQYFLNGINGAGGSTTKKNGLSVNGWVGLIDNLRLVARYDMYTPDADNKNTVAGTSVQNLVVGALDWSVRKNVHLMPNVEYVAYGLSGSKADVIGRATFFITF
ncbi:MAG TPA: hypothetical protein VLX91_02645 [Candidatus Acidoferrales bacterium]|nr:hypothetical protein [Candidatus Acidoferrales bacterium]